MFSNYPLYWMNMWSILENYFFFLLKAIKNPLQMQGQIQLPPVKPTKMRPSVDKCFTLSVYGPYFLASAVFSLITCVLPSLVGIREHNYMSEDVIAWLGKSSISIEYFFFWWKNHESFPSTVNICLIGIPSGCYLSWFIGDTLGQKNIVSISHILPWLLLAIVDSLSLIYWALLMIGCGNIVMSIPVFIYVKGSEKRYL